MSRPDPPINVVAVPFNACATVYWTAPDDHGGYIYQYTVVSFPDNQMVVTPGETITSIFGLTNGVEYQFGVIATNQYGDSDMSALSSRVTPHEKTLPSPPLNQMAFTRPNAIFLTWDSPSSNGGEPVIQYTITRTDTGEQWIYPVSEDDPGITHSYNYLWENLDNYTVYSFTISCSTSLGKSIEAFFGSIAPSPAPYPPTNVYIETNFNDLTFATVFWTPSATDPLILPVTNYVIVVEPSLSYTPLTVGPTNTSWTITGLNPSVVYYFYVYAINDSGSSAYSSVAGPNQIIRNFNPVGYKPLVTGGNDPSLSKKMRYAYSIGRLRKSQYVNYGGGAAFYT